MIAGLMFYMLVGTAFLQLIKYASGGKLDDLDLLLAILWPATFVGMLVVLITRKDKGNDYPEA